jgi:hypothetical protein
VPSVLNAEAPRITVTAVAAMVESGGTRLWSEEVSGILEAS